MFDIDYIYSVILKSIEKLKSLVKIHLIVIHKVFQERIILNKYKKLKSHT